MKKFSVVLAAAALLLSSGVAHADPVTDQINHYSYVPGMVTFLHSVQGITPLNDPSDVDNFAFVGVLYCHPGNDTLNSVGMTLPQWKADLYTSVIVSVAADAGTPGIAVPLRSALDTFCAV